MAALGNIGNASSLPPGSSALSMFGRNQTAPITISIPGIPPNTVVFLFTLRGAPIDATAADPSGVAEFFDFDDGYYTVYANNTGDVWRVTVSAGTVSVVKMFTSNRATAFSWVG